MIEHGVEVEYRLSRLFIIMDDGTTRTVDDVRDTELSEDGSKMCVYIADGSLYWVNLHNAYEFWVSPYEAEEEIEA